MRSLRCTGLAVASLSLALILNAVSVPQASGQMVTWDAPAVVDASGKVPTIAASASALHLLSIVPFPTGVIHYQRSLDDGLTWQDDYTLTDSAWVVGRVAAGGNLVIAAWSEVVSGREVRMARSLDNGATWEAEEALSAPIGELRCTGLAVSGSDAAVSWEEVVGGVATVYVRVSHDSGASWEPASVAAVAAQSAALGEGGVAISESSLVVSYADGSSAKVVASTDWGATWGEPTTLASGSGAFHLRELSASGDNVLTHVMETPAYAHTVAHSADRGMTWSMYPFGNGSMPGNVALAGSTGFVSWGTASLLQYTVSTDGGQTWPEPETLAVEIGDATSSVVQTPYVYVAEFDPANGGVRVRRGSLTAYVSIVVPASGQVFPAGTTSAPITIRMGRHPESGKWAWQLDTPFPASGPAGGNLVSFGDTAPITGLADGQTYTVHVALVRDDGDLVDPSFRDEVTFTVGDTRAAIVAPTAGQQFVAGTTSTDITVDVANHLGYWAWRLGLPFMASGPAGGTPVPSGNTATISGLTDGSHAVYVALVGGNGDLLSPSIHRSVAFTVGTPTAPAGGALLTVVDRRGVAASTVSVPIDTTDMLGLDVRSISLSLTYDSQLLTPITANTSLGMLDPNEWSLEQNVIAPGQLNLSMAASSAGVPSGSGTLLTVEFDISATATVESSTALRLTRADLSEGIVPSAVSAGTFSVVEWPYGDVSGNGIPTAYDAAWILEYVVTNALGSPVLFPIETTAPVWWDAPLAHDDAVIVADVDGSGAATEDIAAADASLLLQYDVGLITAFPVENSGAAPALTPLASAYRLRGASQSSRPGARIGVSLDARSVLRLMAGELVLAFDASLLTAVDVSLRHGGAKGAAQQPLLVQRARDGQLAVAFACARPIEASAAVLDITFEAFRDIPHARESTIRASHLRLNRSLIETDFAFPFRIEPFANRLMANYPNPFNPETWIPFELAADSDVTVLVYGLDGSLVRTLAIGRRPMGEYRARDEAAYWDGRNESGEQAASGVYIYELQAGAHRSMRRMTVLK